MSITNVQDEKVNKKVRLTSLKIIGFGEEEMLTASEGSSLHNLIYVQSMFNRYTLWTL